MDSGEGPSTIERDTLTELSHTGLSDRADPVLSRQRHRHLGQRDRTHGDDHRGL